MYIRIATAEENINEHKAIAIDYPKCRIEKKRKKAWKNSVSYLWDNVRYHVIWVPEGGREWIFEEIMTNIFFQIWWELYSRSKKLSETQAI